MENKENFLIVKHFIIFLRQNFCCEKYIMYLRKSKLKGFDFIGNIEARYEANRFYYDTTIYQNDFIDFAKNLLVLAFDWRNSEEGIGFWAYINKKWRRYLSIIDDRYRFSSKSTKKYRVFEQ